MIISVGLYHPTRHLRSVLDCIMAIVASVNVSLSLLILFTSILDHSELI